MSKTSQRRLAAQRSRAAEVRGSPEKRFLALLGQDRLYYAPTSFWRECIKHLPADPVTQATTVLREAISELRPFIDRAAAGWNECFCLSEGCADEVFPGFLAEFRNVESADFDVRPFSVFGRAVADDTDMCTIALNNLSEECVAGVWVFGSVLTEQGETYALAVHRDGTATAAIRADGQWLNSVPTFTAGRAAHSAAAWSIDEAGEEAFGIVEAHLQLSDAKGDETKIPEILRQVADRVQTPYMLALWRLSLENLSTDEVVKEMKGHVKNTASAVKGLDRRVNQQNGEVLRLRSQLDRALARERELGEALLSASRSAVAVDVKTPSDISPAQRLAGIF